MQYPGGTLVMKAPSYWTFTFLLKKQLHNEKNIFPDIDQPVPFCSTDCADSKENPFWDKGRIKSHCH